MSNPVMREIVTGITEAVAADDFRFDGSDSMPPAVAAAFNQGMMRMFREGSLETLDDVAVDIAGRIERTWRSAGPPD